MRDEVLRGVPHPLREQLEVDLAKLRSRNKVLMNENRALKRERDEWEEAARDTGKVLQKIAERIMRERDEAVALMRNLMNDTPPLYLQGVRDFLKRLPGGEGA